MKFWPFLGTITYPKDNFCFHESIFQCKLSLFLTEVSFEASEENQLSYFQKGYFFKILWWFHQPHNQVKCRQKNKMFSEVFTKWTIVLKIVTFLTGQSLPITSTVDHWRSVEPVYKIVVVNFYYSPDSNSLVTVHAQSLPALD